MENLIEKIMDEYVATLRYQIGPLGHWWTISAVVETHDRWSNKIYNSKLTMI